MFDRLLEWWKARQRGEVRIAPYGSRGRVFVKKSGTSDSGGQMPTKSCPKASIAIRVFRVATGEWEDHGVTSGPEQTKVTRPPKE